MPRSVFVAVDGSSVSEREVALAAEIARMWEARCVLLHVRPAGASPGEGSMEARLARLAERVRESGVNEVTVELLEGPPVDAILGYAEAHPPDLIVFGRRGASPGARMLLGGVSAAILQHAQWPVLLVP